MPEQPVAIWKKLIVAVLLAVFGVTLSFAKPTVTDPQSSRAHGHHLQPKRAIRSAARSVRLHSTAFIRTACLRLRAPSGARAHHQADVHTHPQIESRAASPDPVQLPEFVVAHPTLISQLPDPRIAPPPDVPINPEMAAYYVIVTNYPVPDSVAHLPQLPGPSLLAATRTVHSGGRGHPALHKLLLPVRMVEIASIDTARALHKVFVSAHSPDQQSAFAEETHRLTPDSTRDPCRNHMCYRLPPYPSG